MAKKLTVEEMQAYIAEHLDLISEKKRETFDAMSVEDQFKKIKQQEAAKKFAAKKKGGFVSSKAGMMDRVRDLFEKYGVTFEELDEIAAFCVEYKNEIKEKQIKSLDEQIAELQARRAELEK